MKSRCRLLVSQSLTVSGPCKITLSEGGSFSVGGGTPIPSAQLTVEGDGAEVSLNQAALCGEHAVEILE